MRIIQKEKGDSVSISALEAYGLIEKTRGDNNAKESEAFRSILAYLKSFSMQRSLAWAESARKILMDGGLTDYEASLIINLSPERHTDAKALIPSLSYIENLTLDILLNEISDASNKY